MTESILLSVKQQLGICDDYNAYDDVIITGINSAFTVLDQLGVSLDPSFHVEGENETWEDYFQGRTDLQMVKSYIYLKVKLLFDPPNSGVLHQAMERQIQEFEWRLNVQVDPGRYGVEEGGDEDDPECEGE